jgi:hypothetical protein
MRNVGRLVVLAAAVCMALWPCSAAGIISVHNTIGFVHMRKAGGSHFVDIVESWMKYLGCIGTDVYQTVGAYGIQSGRVSDKTISLCPNISLAHIEYSCLDGEALLENLDAHSSCRLNDNFTLVTVIRDPLERIGSQAFYGPRNTFGLREINREVDHLCSKGQKRVKRLEDARHIIKTTPKNEFTKFLQQCSDQAVANALKRIKNNSSMWYEWFENDLGFGDAYMPNYYIRRLASKPTSKVALHSLVTSADCVRNITASPTGGICVKNSNYLVMKELLGSCECRMSDPRWEFDPVHSLQVAKELLDKHFTVILLEYLDSHPDTYLNQLSSVLKISPDEVAKVLAFHKARQNSGILQFGGSYTDLMPQEILEHLEKTNSFDIQLYSHLINRQFMLELKAAAGVETRRK